MTTETRLRKFDTLVIAGLAALTIGALAEAMRVIGIRFEWFGDEATAARALLIVWIAGSLIFAITFGWVWVSGRLLTAQQRAGLEDEYLLYLGRRAAILAFVAAYVSAVAFVAIPGTEDVPGRAVGLIVMAAATGGLALGRWQGARS